MQQQSNQEILPRHQSKENMSTNRKSANSGLRFDNIDVNRVESEQTRRDLDRNQDYMDRIGRSASSSLERKIYKNEKQNKSPKYEYKNLKKDNRDDKPNPKFLNSGVGQIENPKLNNDEKNNLLNFNPMGNVDPSLLYNLRNQIQF